MRVLIAPDSFAGSLSAAQAAEAIAEGWRRAAPHDRLTLLPLSDGGPGFLDVLARALGGETVAVTVSDPLGRPVPAALLLVERDGRRTAYVETAQACGLHLLAGAASATPARTSSYGVGQLLAAALAEGATRLVVGLGGAGTNDGGAGMLAALGAGPAEQLARGGAALAGLPDERAGRPGRGARAPAGASSSCRDATWTWPCWASTAPARRTPRTRAPPPSRPSSWRRRSAGSPRSCSAPGAARSRTCSAGRAAADREPGAGAAGGLGFGLLLLGAHRVRRRRGGAAGRRLRDASSPPRDLVVTGEGCFDWQSLRGERGRRRRRPGARGGRARRRRWPARSLVGRRETMALGIAGTYAVAEPGHAACARCRPTRPAALAGPRGAGGPHLVPAALTHDVRLRTNRGTRPGAQGWHCRAPTVARAVPADEHRPKDLR